MKVTSIITVEQIGIGKPDYTREVSSALERKGLRLTYKQRLKIFGLVFSDYNIGIHTAAPHATVMTDATAYFAVNMLVGFLIRNVTDGSYGIIITNTVNTITVVALVGGVANLWNTGDAYVIPSPFAWVNPPLAAGGSAHLIDNETGLVAPYTIPQGYILAVIEASHSSNEDVEIWGHVDGAVYTGMGIVSAGQQILDHRVLGFTTEVFDPTGALPHRLDVIVKNTGVGALRGGFSLICIQEEVGTPPPPIVKTVQCKFCGHKETVPQEITNWICPKCGQLNIYLTLPGFRGTR